VIAKTVQRPTMKFDAANTADRRAPARPACRVSRRFRRELRSRLARAGVPQPELLAVFAILYATWPDSFAARCHWDACSAYCRICSTEALKAGGESTASSVGTSRLQRLQELYMRKKETRSWDPCDGAGIKP
jgi:hypothetical protein